MPHILPPVEPADSAWVRPGGLRGAAEPLPDIDDPAFAAAFDRFGDAKVVLLGASTDGTSEFHRARAAITRWLVRKRGFRILALEADWPVARAMDARVRRRTRAGVPIPEGFPAWAWRNREMDTFLTDLTAHNAAVRRGDRVALHGLDLYNLAGSTRAVVDYLDRTAADAALLARRRYGRPEPWASEPAYHGRGSITGRYAGCETAVTDMLCDALRRQFEEAEQDEDDLLDAGQTAGLVQGAEAYYRAMYYGGSDAWSLRAAHMFSTLKALLDGRGQNGRAIIWAHNAQVGDGRATEMGLRGEQTLGQLCREAWGNEACLIGFGAGSGTVGCASEWGGAMEIKPIHRGMGGSHEAACHDAGLARFLLDLSAGNPRHAGRRPLSDPGLERFVGPIYRPDDERGSHYAECRLAEQFDAWVWFDETTAVSPLSGRR